VDEVAVSHETRDLIIKLQVLPTVCYLQGWMQVSEEWIKWVMAFREIENLDAHEGTCGQVQDVSDFVEGSSLILF
jgi:hypothetical protein